MNLQRKTAIVIAVCALLIASGGILWYTKAKKAALPGNRLDILSDQVDLEVRNVVYREVGSEDAKWEIRARKASYLKKEQKVSFEQADVKILLSDGRTLLLKGDRGHLNTASKDITVSGNVSMDAGRGEILKTDYLNYSFAEKRIHTEAAVLMEKPGMRIQGVGMSLSLKDRDMVLLSKVHGSIERKHVRE